jgi:hypothetical protein
MAIGFFSTGPCSVFYDAVELGFCENGAEITVQPFFEDLHADSWGGLAGPFADRQLLGAIAQVNCLLTKFDNAACEKLTSFTEQGDGDAGIIGPSYGSGVLDKLGTFVYQDAQFGILELKTTLASSSKKFDYAHVAGSIGFNMGMRHRRWQVQFLCRMDSPCTRVLYETGTDTSCFDD